MNGLSFFNKIVLMRVKLFCLFMLGFGLVFNLSAQEQSYKIGAIGFYNFENLFDTLDTPDVRDSEFTPKGKKAYGGKIYQEKLDHLSSVVSQMATDVTPDGLAILGVCEIENRSVLEDFVKMPKIKDRNYQIVHYDSPDKRGIDVGLIYNPKYFKVTHSEPLLLDIQQSDGDTVFTRDILYVNGEFDGDLLHVFVNHWPSRSGGEKRSAWRRNAAAQRVRGVIDSLLAADANAKIVVMGDLNDDPNNDSCKKYIGAQRKKEKMKKDQLYNPMWDYYNKGIGTTAWQDAWSLFDQIHLSYALSQRDEEGYFFYKANIFNKKYLRQRTGRFQGYPFRTFVGDSYLGGYSDHFPVYVYLVKAVTKK